MGIYFSHRDVSSVGGAVDSIIITYIMVSSMEKQEIPYNFLLQCLSMLADGKKSEDKDKISDVMMIALKERDGKE